ncbi:MAG: hydroxymethylbilane synthase [Betaproteobacteria bacterium]|nr:hydroxymethylbilane synthase [Betaproteobacteria bacterium]
MLHKITGGFPAHLTIATRESQLALWQARHVQARLNELYPHLQVNIFGMTTEGDRKLATSLAKIGGKGLFVKELEEALADTRADIAVHSLKDVPMQLPEGFGLGAILVRADPRDALVSNQFKSLAALPKGARVGTSSLRRESQLRAKFPHLTIEPLRGNVNTRLKKLDDGQYDAIILAAAGLKRLEMESRIAAVLSPDEMLPAVGQGALAVECLRARADVLTLLAPLHDDATAACAAAERAFSRALAGSCNVPIGGYAEVTGTHLTLRGYVGAPDGTRHVSARIEGKATEAQALGTALAAELKREGAAGILAALAGA